MKLTTYRRPGDTVKHLPYGLKHRLPLIERQKTGFIPPDRPNTPVRKTRPYKTDYRDFLNCAKIGHVAKTCYALFWCDIKKTWG